MFDESVTRVGSQNEVDEEIQEILLSVRNSDLVRILNQIQTVYEFKRSLEKNVDAKTTIKSIFSDEKFDFLKFRVFCLSGGADSIAERPLCEVAHDLAQSIARVR